jgi:HD-like signal output (HDOD) protein
MPTVRAIARDAAEQDHRMSAFILGVVNSTPFRMNRVVTTEDGGN